MSREYDLYLHEHKANVKKGYLWIKENLPDLIPNDIRLNLEHQICFAHDYSKSELDEYEAYDKYFYGGNRSYQVVEDFNYAWLMHIHRNPHHWQHWVLLCDEPNEGEIILDMPYQYILEMICDWWAFSWAKENLYEIFDWYDKRKDYIKISDKTRKTVEDILEKIHNKLDVESELVHHGIKGQHWGERNGPPYPLNRNPDGNIIKNKTNKLVEDAINSGEVLREVNEEKQQRHNKAGHTPGRSYLNGDMEYAKGLVNKYSGTGESKLNRKGKWNHRETIISENDIGIYVNADGKEIPSNVAMIIYSNTGTHIYPVRRKDDK